MAIRHAKVPAGTDMTPVLKGLPEDRCPTSPLGHRVEGSIHMRHADGSEETVEVDVPTLLLYGELELTPG